MTAFCTLCGNTEPGDLGATIGICLNAEACHRRQDRNREHRAWVAEEIARAIEDSVREPGTRWAQSRADAALARKIGRGESPDHPVPASGGQDSSEERAT